MRERSSLGPCCLANCLHGPTNRSGRYTSVVLTRPVGIVGHLSSKMAAVYAAERVTFAETITAAYYRGHMVSFNKLKGAIFAVSVISDKVIEDIQDARLGEKVRVAAIKSPDSTTISSDTEAIEILSMKMTQDGVFNRVLRMGGHAFHSHHMLPLGHNYTEAVDGGKKVLEQNGIDEGSMKFLIIPWISSFTPSKQMNIFEQGVPSSCWRSNLESPVRFAEAFRNCLILMTRTSAH
jgi:acyl transferase domain-containing protein